MADEPDDFITRPLTQEDIDVLASSLSVPPVCILLESYEGAREAIYMHRGVLSHYSEYFKGLFSSGLAESSSGTLGLPGVDIPAAKQVLQFMYSGTAPVRPDSLAHLLSTAARLLVPTFLRAAAAFLEDRLSPPSACVLLSTAQALHLSDLAERCLTCIRGGLLEAAESAGWAALSIEAVEEVLSDNGLDVRRESEALYAAAQWLSDPSRASLPSPARLALLLRLAGPGSACVRHQALDPEDIASLCQTISDLGGDVASLLGPEVEGLAGGRRVRPLDRRRDRIQAKWPRTTQGVPSIPVDSPNAGDLSMAAGLIGTGVRTGALVLHDLHTGAELHRAQVHRACIIAVAFSPDGRLLATGSEDCESILWDVFGGDAAGGAAQGAAAQGGAGAEVAPLPLTHLLPHGMELTGCAFSSDSRLLATASFDGVAHIYFLPDLIPRARGATAAATAAGAALPVRTAFESDHVLRIRVDEQAEGRGAAGQVLAQVLGVPGAGASMLGGCNFHPHKPILAAAVSARPWPGIDLFEISEPSSSAPGGPVPMKARHCGFLQGHGEGVWQVAFSPNGRCIASASFDHSVRVYDIETREQLAAFSHMNQVLSIHYSPCGRLLTSSSRDGTVSVHAVQPPGRLRRAAGGKAGTAVAGARPGPEGMEEGSAGSDSAAARDHEGSSNGAGMESEAGHCPSEDPYSRWVPRTIAVVPLSLEPGAGPTPLLGDSGPILGGGAKVEGYEVRFCDRAGSLVAWSSTGEIVLLEGPRTGRDVGFGGGELEGVLASYGGTLSGEGCLEGGNRGWVDWTVRHRPSLG